MGSNSLQYLSIDSMKAALGDGDYEYCDACFSGTYPSRFPWGMELGQMELFLRGEK
jgi:glutamine phosphoribosylpyrophosphate amidotransferase